MEKVCPVMLREERVNMDPAPQAFKALIAQVGRFDSRKST